MHTLTCISTLIINKIKRKEKKESCMKPPVFYEALFIQVANLPHAAVTCPPNKEQ